MKKHLVICRDNSSAATIINWLSDYHISYSMSMHNDDSMTILSFDCDEATMRDFILYVRSFCAMSDVELF